MKPRYGVLFLLISLWMGCINPSEPDEINNDRPPEPPAAAFFNKCEMSIIYYGEHRFWDRHAGEITERAWKFYPDQGLDPVSLVDGSFSDSRSIDDSNPLIFYRRNSSISCRIDSNRTTLIRASISTTVSTNNWDRESFNRSCRINKCVLVRSDADTVIYRFNGAPGPEDGEFILEGDSWRHICTNIEGTPTPHVDVIFSRLK